MQIISSKENETIKMIKKLKEKKYRDEEKMYIVEGIKMVKEAIQENANIHKIIISEELLKKENVGASIARPEEQINVGADFHARPEGVPCPIDKTMIVTQNVFKFISDVTNPQGILAVIEKEKKEEIDYETDFLLILDGLQDPGNLGTILRTADSVGLNQIIVSNGTVDSYNPKVIRSTMGASFRVRVIESDDLVKTIKEIRNHGFKIAATDLNTNQTIYNMEMKKVAIIIGNEANGVSKEVLEVADEKVKIPMLGKTESLNAAVATGVILYEYVRRKI